MHVRLRLSSTSRLASRKTARLCPLLTKFDSHRLAICRTLPLQEVFCAIFSLRSMDVSEIPRIDNPQVVKISYDWDTISLCQVQILCCHKKARKLTSKFVTGLLCTNLHQYPRQAVALRRNRDAKANQQVGKLCCQRTYGYITLLTVNRLLFINSRTDHCRADKLNHGGITKPDQHVLEQHILASHLTRLDSKAR